MGNELYERIKKKMSFDEAPECLAQLNAEVQDGSIGDAYVSVDEFADYKKYKDEYKKTGSNDSLTMSHQELGHFLTNLKDMFKELNEHSKDNTEERAMVKSAIKEIYQLFS